MTMDHHLLGEPYPKGTNIMWPCHQNDLTVNINGTVISVPLPLTSTQLPASSADEPPYTIQLVDQSTVHASPTFMEHIVDCQGPFQDIHTLPTWMGNKQKVMYLCNGQYVNRATCSSSLNQNYGISPINVTMDLKYGGSISLIYSIVHNKLLMLAH